MSLPSGDVDWDFGYDGRLDGLNPWFLWCFAQDGTDNFPEFKNKISLDDAFSAAVSQGLIHRPFKALQDDLYYLHGGVSQNKALGNYASNKRLERTRTERAFLLSNFGEPLKRRVRQHLFDEVRKLFNGNRNYVVRVPRVDEAKLRLQGG